MTTTKISAEDTRGEDLRAVLFAFVLVCFLLLLTGCQRTEADDCCYWQQTDDGLRMHCSYD